MFDLHSCIDFVDTDLNLVGMGLGGSSGVPSLSKNPFGGDSPLATPSSKLSSFATPTNQGFFSSPKSKKQPARTSCMIGLK